MSHDVSEQHKMYRAPDCEVPKFLKEQIGPWKSLDVYWFSDFVSVKTFRGSKLADQRVLCTSEDYIYRF